MATTITGQKGTHDVSQQQERTGDDAALKRTVKCGAMRFDPMWPEKNWLHTVFTE